MRFLRHLAAAALVVAAVVLLGLAWAHFGASTLVSGVGHQVQQELAAGGTHGPGIYGFGHAELGLGSMLDPANLPVLRHTVVIEIAVIAGVVILDVMRLWARRADRRDWLAQSQYRSEDDADE
jgi:hypothetical protein